MHDPLDTVKGVDNSRPYIDLLLAAERGGALRERGSSPSMPLVTGGAAAVIVAKTRLLPPSSSPARYLVAPLVLEAPPEQEVQADTEVAPVIEEKEPTGQLVQAVAPVESEYVPEGHSLQAAEPTEAWK